MTKHSVSSLADQAALLAAVEETSASFCTQALAAIEAENPAINAVTATDRVRYETLAQEADVRRAAGKPKGPLDGIPFAFKANILCEGFADHAGIKGRIKALAPKDAHAITRLLDAGMIPLAQTNMDEGALGITGRNSHFGPVINPLNPDFSPGGSSSGSAAAITAGMVSAALGSDSLGSIRIPAALCGIAGLKPTRNLVRTLGTIPLAWTFDHLGPMANTATDIFMMLSALLGVPADPSKLPGTIKGLNIGVPYDFIKTCPALENTVFRAFEASIKKLADLGAIIRPVSLRNYPMEAARLAAFQICEIETAEFHGAMLNDNPDAFSDEFAAMLRWGMQAGEQVKLKALTTVAAAGDSFDEALMELDAMITPTLPVAGFPAGGEAPKGTYDYTAPANFAGLPAIAIPAGEIMANGLPFSLQIIGNALEERKIISIAKCLNAEYPGTEYLGSQI